MMTSDHIFVERHWTKKPFLSNSDRFNIQNRDKAGFTSTACRNDPLTNLLEDRWEIDKEILIQERFLITMRSGSMCSAVHVVSV